MRRFRQKLRMISESMTLITK